MKSARKGIAKIRFKKTTVVAFTFYHGQIEKIPVK
jgi:hypothetical protein